MTGRETFADGYLDGWEGVMGDAPPPPVPDAETPADLSDYQFGYEYGRADGLQRQADQIG